MTKLQRGHYWRISGNHVTVQLQLRVSRGPRAHINAPSFQWLGYGVGRQECSSSCEVSERSMGDSWLPNFLLRPAADLPLSD